MDEPGAVLGNMVVKEFRAQILAHAETITTANLNFVKQFRANAGVEQHIHSGVLEGIAHLVVPN